MPRRSQRGRGFVLPGGMVRDLLQVLLTLSGPALWLVPDPPVVDFPDRLVAWAWWRWARW